MIRSKTYQVKGIHCASCASIIERAVKKIDGVQSISVNSGTENAKISFDENGIDEKLFNKKLEPLGYSLKDNAEHTAHSGINQSKQEKLQEIDQMKKGVAAALPLAIISILIMSWEILSKYDLVPMMSENISTFFHHLLPIFATFIFATIGKPYILGFYRFIRYGKANMDTLIGIGTISAFFYSFIVTAFKDILEPFINVNQNYYDVVIVVITFIALGKYLEAQSKVKTGDAIEKLLGLQAKTAFVIRNGKEIEIQVSEVKHGDLIIVKPGGKIPVDGVITKGKSYVNESMVTGEPMPSLKTVNSNVIAGTMNTDGSFTFKATKIGSETLLAQIVKMVEEAQGSKAPIQALADKISSIFVPVVLVIAFVTLGSWLIFGTEILGFSKALSSGIVSFVGILIIACPCALGLATPTAIIVGVGKGAKEGILIKDAATLEKLHQVNTVVVDKTGTITIGNPTITDIKNLSNLTDNKLISILSSLEKNSEHPIAKAIVNFAKEKNISTQNITGFKNIEGKGITGFINKKRYFTGNTELIKDLNLNFNTSQIEEFTAQGKTPVILATKEKVLCFIMVSDKIKSESKQAISDLHKLGIKVVMLTGDNEKAARHIASLIGVDDVVAQVLPKDKLSKIKSLQSQGRIVAMAGDGVNDAPALAQADVGIAMGTGTDVAIESAGITLLGGDISKLVKAINLSKITMRGIKQNLFWAFIYNIIGIPLAAGAFYPVFGWLLSPVFAGFAMAMSSVSVVSNSLRIKAQKI